MLEKLLDPQQLQFKTQSLKQLPDLTNIYNDAPITALELNILYKLNIKTCTLSSKSNFN
jgi:uncharacterized pyridoxamine 5'-phosphate oxidase family protein